MIHTLTSTQERTNELVEPTATWANMAETAYHSDLPDTPWFETVLLVEDSEELSQSLSLRLNSQYFNVLRAFDGVTGLEKIEAFDPDLLIVDIGLPRMNGMLLLHTLRNIPGLGDIPTIVVTGSQDSGLEERALKFGVERFFQKPASQKQIVQAVSEILRGA